VWPDPEDGGRIGDLPELLRELTRDGGFRFTAGQPGYWDSDGVRVSVDPLRNPNPEKRVRHLVSVLTGSPCGEPAGGMMLVLHDGAGRRNWHFLDRRGQAMLFDLEVGTQYFFRIEPASLGTHVDDGAVAGSGPGGGAPWSWDAPRWKLDESLGVAFGHSRLARFGMAAYASELNLRDPQAGDPLLAADPPPPVDAREAFWVFPLPQSERHLVVRVRAGAGGPSKPLWEIGCSLDPPEAELAHAEVLRRDDPAGIWQSRPLGHMLSIFEPGVHQLRLHLRQTVFEWEVDFRQRD
jgi:hypothetical protein